MANPVQYIIINKSLSMSPGKLAAQAAHASQLGLLTHVDNDTRESPYNDKLVNLWMRGGHYAKVVLEADDLTVAERYLNDRGFKTALVIDEGRTEIEPMSPTAIGTGVVDKDQGHVRATFGEFKLYTESDPSDDEILERAAKISDARMRELLTPEAFERITRAEDEAFIGGGEFKAPKDWLTTSAFKNADNFMILETARRMSPEMLEQVPALLRDGDVEGAKELLADDEPKFGSREYVRQAFRRVRERLEERHLDEDYVIPAEKQVLSVPPIDDPEPCVIDRDFPWPPTVRQT